MQSHDALSADKKIKRIRLLLSITFFVLIVVGMTAIYTIGTVKGNIFWVQHTKDVLQVSDELYASCLEAESSARGYALSGDSSFRISYNKARKESFLLLDSLRLMSNDNYAQQHNIRDLKSVIDRKMVELDENLIFRGPDSSFVPDSASLPLREDLMISSDIRIRLAEINKLENLLLYERNKGLRNNLNTLPAILLISTLIGIGIAGLSLYTMIQYNKHRLQAQEAIHAYQLQLTDQIERLNMSNKELEQFAYVASHDLQEPLRKISAFSDLLNDQYKDKLEGEGSLYLSRIVNSSTRMRKLINDLLNYSRVGRKPIAEEIIALDELMPTILEDLEILIKEKKADISLTPLPEVKGSPSEIRQLFQNLLVNALKFSKPDEPTVIQITAHPASREEVARHSTLDPMALYHVIRIKDQGIGFDQQYADRIFVIFQRLHGKDKYEGTGIGLAVCKKITEKLHGAIYAESEPGQGATFTLLLPMVAES